MHWKPICWLTLQDRLTSVILQLLMTILFKNKTYFAILFGVLLLLDIYVKINLDAIPYRYFTKPLIMGFLIVFYFLNRKNPHKRKHNLMAIALFSFLLGDVLLIHYEIIEIYIFALLLFVAGKLFYAARFSHQRDFKIMQLAPFFIGCFIYMIIIMLMVMNNLKEFFIPTLMYLFACLIVFLFGFLRKGVVNSKSYILVIIGISFSIFSDSISVLQSFYNPDFPFHKIGIMLFYGISQYFIVLGIVEEEFLLETKDVS